MFADGDPQPRGHRFLPLFNARVDELFDLAAVHAHDMIVMRPLVEFEYGHAILEMMARDQAGRLELRQYPVDRSEADVLGRAEEPAVDLFGGHVAGGPAPGELQGLYAAARRPSNRPALNPLLPLPSP